MDSRESYKKQQSPKKSPACLPQELRKSLYVVGKRSAKRLSSCLISDSVQPIIVSDVASPAFMIRLANSCGVFLAVIYCQVRVQFDGASGLYLMGIGVLSNS